MIVKIYNLTRDFDCLDGYGEPATMEIVEGVKSIETTSQLVHAKVGYYYNVHIEMSLEDGSEVVSSTNYEAFVCNNDGKTIEKIRPEWSYETPSELSPLDSQKESEISKKAA